ncbi:MAG: APC family permease [Bacteroidetes bacterium]|nr:APC family permease [Bacteroidota bacterium]
MTKTARLSLFDFTMIVVGLVIGMGIFRTPLNTVKASPTPFVFFAVWIAGGIIALCGALTYAEIGSRLPVTGGYYKVFSYAYHPSIAFGVNCLILVSNSASLAGVAIVGGEYMTGILVPASKQPGYMSIPANAHHIQVLQNGLAIAAIIVFYGVNLLGLKMSARTQNVLTIIKIGLILLLVTPLFFSAHAPASATATTAAGAYNFMDYIKAFGVALVAVSFTYGGYQQTVNFGAEVERANKNVPRGIFLGIFIIISLYLCINYAYIHVIGFEEMKHSRNIAAIMASHVFGENAERVLSVLLFFSVLGYVNVLLLSNPRVMSAMSDDNILPLSFGRRHPRTGTLTVSLTVFAGLSALIVFWAKEFDTILSFSIFLDCFGMILSVGSIFVLRRKLAQQGREDFFKMKAYPLQPIVFIAAYVFIAISLLINETAISLTGLGVLAGFIILYFLLQKLKGFKKE